MRKITVEGWRLPVKFKAQNNVIKKKKIKIYHIKLQIFQNRIQFYNLIIIYIF